MLYAQGIRACFLRLPGLLPGLRVLDAGCGTGVVTLALREALLRRGLPPRAMHAFDLTPAMLDRFERTLRREDAARIELALANVLELKQLPHSWSDYDLVVSASMLEYVPRTRFAEALTSLRRLLVPGGRFLLFVTKRNWLMRPLIETWWKGNLYAEPELQAAFETAGFESILFSRFPPAFRHLGTWGHIVEARSSRCVV